MHSPRVRVIDVKTQLALELLDVRELELLMKIIGDEIDRRKRNGKR